MTNTIETGFRSADEYYADERNQVRPDRVESGENHVSRKSVWPSNSDVEQMEFHGWRGTTNEIKAYVGPPPYNEFT